jgi:hypothetical protein
VVVDVDPDASRDAMTAAGWDTALLEAGAQPFAFFA